MDPFTSGQIQSLHYSIFSRSLLLMRCHSLLLLLVCFGVAVLARGPNHCHSINCMHSFSHCLPCLCSSPSPNLPRKISQLLLCNQIICLQPFNTYFPNLFRNTGRQPPDPLQLIKSRRSTCYMTRGNLFNGHNYPSDKDPLQQKTDKTPLPFSELAMMVSC